MDKKVVLDNTILLVRHGSHAYGLNHADSDIDAKGVVVPPPEWYLGLRHFEQFEDFDDPNDFSRDQVRYKVQKFISLASDCNPNIIECLFVDESDIVEITPEGRELVAHRNDFVSLKAKHTFSGYAVSQLKKIQIKRKWFVEPPTHKPLQSEFMRSPTTETEMGLLAEGAKFFDKAAYVAAIEHWNNYLRWKNERNPARKELEEKFGFDCYVEETEFLTDNGWKTFDEVADEDRLATIYFGNDKVTSKFRRYLGIEYQKPIDRFSGAFSGDLVELIGYHVKCRITPNHNMLYKSMARNLGKEMVPLHLGEAGLLPDCFEVLRVPTPKTRCYKISEQLKGLPITPMAFMRLMGWYLSDGSMGFKNGDPAYISISQKLGNRLHAPMLAFNNKYKKRASTSIYKYNRKRNYGDMTEITLHVRNKEIVNRIYKECGAKRNKRIPRWVFSTTKSYMMCLLQALIAGDGTIKSHKTKDDTWIYYSSLKNLADDVQELAIHCGLETSIYGPYGYDHEICSQYNYCPMYHVFIDRSPNQFKRMTRKTNIKRIAVKDKRIVCFTVPNRTLVTRYNGHVSFHGNSKHASHLVRLLRMGKAICEFGKVIVKRPDREEILAIRNGAWTYEQLLEWAEKELASLDALYNDYKSGLKISPIPHSVDRRAIDKLAVDITLKHWSRKQIGLPRV